MHEFEKIAFETSCIMCFFPCFLKNKLGVLLLGTLIPLFWISGDLGCGIQSQGRFPRLSALSPMYNGFLRFPSVLFWRNPELKSAKIQNSLCLVRGEGLEVGFLSRNLLKSKISCVQEGRRGGKGSMWYNWWEFGMNYKIQIFSTRSDQLHHRQSPAETKAFYTKSLAFWSPRHLRYFTAISYVLLESTLNINQENGSLKVCFLLYFKSRFENIRISWNTS